jgi:hypothetical protein
MFEACLRSNEAKMIALQCLCTSSGLHGAFMSNLHGMMKCLRKSVSNLQADSVPMALRLTLGHL